MWFFVAIVKAFGVEADYLGSDDLTDVCKVPVPKNTVGIINGAFWPLHCTPSSTCNVQKQRATNLIGGIRITAISLSRSIEQHFSHSRISQSRARQAKKSVALYVVRPCYERQRHLYRIRTPI